MANRAVSKPVGFILLGVIFLVLAVFLVITLVIGDNTDNRGEHQPEPSPATSSPSDAS